MLINMLGIAGIASGQQLYYPVEFAGIGPAAMYSPKFSAPVYSSQFPALLASQSAVVTGMYAEKKYMSNELVTLLAACSISSESSTTSFAFQQFGNSAFSERQLSLGFAKGLGAVNAGLQFRYVTTKSLQDKIISGMIAMAGASWKMSQNVIAAVKLVNPQEFFKSSDSSTFRFASAFHLGAGYQVNESLYIGMNPSKRSNNLMASRLS